MPEAVKLTTSYDFDKYRYNGYGIGFDAHSQFPLSNGEWGKNVVIFEDDNSSSVYVDNIKKDDTKITAEAKYPANFTKPGRRFLLNLHYNGSNSFLFINAVKMY